MKLSEIEAQMAERGPLNDGVEEVTLTFLRTADLLMDAAPIMIRAIRAAAEYREASREVACARGKGGEAPAAIWQREAQAAIELDAALAELEGKVESDEAGS